MPDISIIVPLLNESAELPELLATLTAQRGVAIELLLCDGGSDDNTLEAAAGLADSCPFPVKLLQTPRGRARQMNAGAAAASAGLLLFLHADSRFKEDNALKKALEFHHARAGGATDLFAARFRLHFRRSTSTRSLAYFFYEAKARLARPDCIRGDQGFLLNREAFSRAGGFDQSLPFLEDIRLVAATAPLLEWQLLPAALSTSARRFEREGLTERQVLNAIIVNNLQAEWSAFFESLPELYRSHCHSAGGRLLLTPILERVDLMIKRSPPEWRREFWRATGRHVAANAWQLFFWLDCRSAFVCRKSPDQLRPGCLDLYRRRLEWLFLSRPAGWLAQAVVRFWLACMLFRGTRRTAAPPAP